jgi:L-ribulose-5-phosphate 3-epimerase
MLEAAQVLRVVKSRWLMLNWDPGNAAGGGEKPYPDGYALLPKDRIGHCQCKDIVMKSKSADYDWVAMGRGIVNTGVKIHHCIGVKIHRSRDADLL